MKKWSLFMILGFMLVIQVGCNNTIEDSSNELNSPNSEEKIEKSSAFVKQKNNEDNLSPIKLTAYSEIVDATLSHPIYEKFTVNKELTVKGTVGKHHDLLGEYVWMKIENLDENEVFEYYIPIINGEFEQLVHFFNGAGDYLVQIMLPSVEKENYFNELASFQVENTNLEKERDIVYTPYGISSGLVINEPNMGMLEGSEFIRIDGEIENQQTVMIQLKKDNHSWQHMVPVDNGRFSYNIPLFYGKGLHEVHILIPDKEFEDRFQYSGSFLINNISEKIMEPIEYHQGYYESGIELETPFYGGEELNLTLPISGKINPDILKAADITHLYIKTIKGQDEALDIIPIKNNHFSDVIYLRFGPGDYEVIINIPVPKENSKDYFRFSSIAGLKVNNTAEDQRDLLPSRGIQSESHEIIALSYEITKDSKNDFEKAKAIYEYTAKTIAYDVVKYNHSTFEWDDSALKTLKLKKGVCQDYAYLAAALLRASNIETRFIAGKAGEGAIKENHAWIEAKVNNEWIIMDPTWGSGYIQNDSFVAKYTDKYFDPDKAEFNQTHVREKPEY